MKSRLSNVKLFCGKIILFLTSVLHVSLFLAYPSSAAINYQDFEPDNGALKENNPAGSPAEYGWGYNGAVTSLSNEGDPVHSGKFSWQVTIPQGKPVHAGTGISSLMGTFNTNFIPACHDRLTFWMWSAPSETGDHNVLVKFFDKTNYNQNGFGIWTSATGRYKQWSEISVLFSQLPTDFDLEHVDKIEFLNYWDGTYYYDDIQVRSAFSLEKDRECLQKEFHLVCQPLSSDEKFIIASSDYVPFFLSPAESQACVSIYSQKSAELIDYLHLQTAQKMRGQEWTRKPHERE